ncbi:Small-conductance mechanosensitive channel [Granulosicoccus antarcticus IMCC3135]|uniref:Small-conductance mechanosensitive channel n=2 Tax=Granulosicoccus TaxID=437504 RepID=A0A2Z2NLV2_9GAMM|nr:Small-conductance mechanosensitive channel [Granulosicoccus antarcticus IMCC3135]
MDWLNYVDEVPTLVREYGINTLAALLIFFMGKWLARRVVNLCGRLMNQRGIDPTVGGFVTNILFMILLMMVIIAALAQLGVPTAQFIAVIGAAGLAIGLALQGSLSNFASGVLLVSFRPCKVGDYIEAGGVSGTVKLITVFSTTLVTPDQRTITVPNSSVMGGPITNYSTSPSRRLDMVIGVSYDSDLAKVKALLREVVESDERVLDSHKPVQIGVLALADSSVNIAIRPWVATEDYWPLHFDLHERIKQRFDQAGIGIPFPQMDVHLSRSETSAAP